MKLHVAATALPLALLAACGAKPEAGQGKHPPAQSTAVSSPAVNDSQPAAALSAPMRSRIWGETDTAGLHRLDAGEIRAALIGKRVSYNPPGWADAGAVEEYQEDGGWRGHRLSRGPVGFSGHWRIADNRLCTRQETGMGGRLDEVCRGIWRDPQTGDLLMEHMMGAGQGLLRLTTLSN